jgi:hypothetical protein
MPHGTVLLALCRADALHADGAGPVAAEMAAVELERANMGRSMRV